MKEHECSTTLNLPSESSENNNEGDFSADGCYCGDNIDELLEPTIDIYEVSNLLDQMIMDIQHLELEVIRARYKLSFFLKPPYDEYLRMEIFSSMGTRYGGDPVYDKYLYYRGFGEYDDAIDTPFHLKRKQRLSKSSLVPRTMLALLKCRLRFLLRESRK